jgi:aspartyl-tRNA synthetase
VFKFCWIVDFPMFEWSEEEKKVDFSHNPFSMPQGEMEALKTKDPLDVLAYQYDIVCNGYELCSGAIRNHKAEIMLKAFEIAGYDASVVEEQFGGMLNAFRYRRAAARRSGPRHRPDRHAAGRPDRNPRGHRLPAEPAGPGPADERTDSEAAERQLKDVHIRTAPPIKV